MAHTSMTRRLSLAIAIQRQTNGVLSGGYVVPFGFGGWGVLPLTGLAFVHLATGSCVAVLSVVWQWGHWFMPMLYHPFVFSHSHWMVAINFS